MSTDHATQRKLTRGQIAVLVLALIPMIAVGVGGAIGTYANAQSQLENGKTALGVVAAGEGATLVAAIVMIGVTLLGQSAPFVVRAALWVLPAAASVMGLAIAPALREAVVYALTPLAMTASAEGISYIARRIVAYTTGVDVEAQRRNADLMRRIAFHAAQAERHPNEKVRQKSALEAWKLMRQVGGGDDQLGSGLIDVQRTRLTMGADSALGAMLAAPGSPVPTGSEPMALEPGGSAHSEGELSPAHAIQAPRPAASGEPTPTALTDLRPPLQPADQQVSREPVLIPAEPTLAKAPRLSAETDPGADGEPIDEREQQIAVLAQRIRAGEPL
ncbi:hypothetical protein, partial [Streptomyces roseoviridis]